MRASHWRVQLVGLVVLRYDRTAAPISSLAAESVREGTCDLFGRRTYEIFADYWDAMEDPGHPIAGALNTQPKDLVASGVWSSAASCAMTSWPAISRCRSGCGSGHRSSTAAATGSAPV